MAAARFGLCLSIGEDEVVVVVAGFLSDLAASKMSMCRGRGGGVMGCGLGTFFFLPGAGDCGSGGGIILLNNAVAGDEACRVPPPMKGMSSGRLVVLKTLRRLLRDRELLELERFIDICAVIC